MHWPVEALACATLTKWGIEQSELDVAQTKTIGETEGDSDHHDRQRPCRRSSGRDRCRRRQISSRKRVAYCFIRCRFTTTRSVRIDMAAGRKIASIDVVTNVKGACLLAEACRTRAFCGTKISLPSRNCS